MKNEKGKGFTITELIITIAIVGVIMIIVITTFSVSSKPSVNAEIASTEKDVRQNLQNKKHMPHMSEDEQGSDSPRSFTMKLILQDRPVRYVGDVLGVTMKAKLKFLIYYGSEDVTSDDKEVNKLIEENSFQRGWRAMSVLVDKIIVKTRDDGKPVTTLCALRFVTKELFQLPEDRWASAVLLVPTEKDKEVWEGHLKELMMGLPSGALRVLPTTELEPAFKRFKEFAEQETTEGL